MAKIITVVNAGPRKGWNTDTLLGDATRGAEDAGASAVRFDLYRLERYTGCVSCFGCKKKANRGKCVLRDGLAPVLDSISESDGLIIGSPNYLGEMSAAFRSLYERLVFRNLTYTLESPCCAGRRIPVLLIMTSNAPDTAYSALLEGYRRTLSRFVGPTDVFVCGDTLQIEDYGATDWPWTMFDPEAKKRRRETVFPEQRKTAYAKGSALVRS